MPEPTLQDKMLALCEKTTECQECHGEGETHYPDDAESRQTCVSCKGTGHRYLLDPDGKFGLRVMCLYCEGTGKANHWPGGQCFQCQGRRWRPTTDLMKAVQAAWNVLLLIDHRNYQRVLEAMGDAFEIGTDPIQAAFDVVASALLGESKVV